MQSTKMINKKRIPIPGIRKIVLVVSGKGGVGKSTISANLALMLYKQGFKIGLLDADIYGPSIPTIFAIKSKPKIINNQLIPFQYYGVKLMSIGFLVPENHAIIWRGPMTTKTLHKLFIMTKWSQTNEDLDYLIIDTPPGTGDVHLSIIENYIVNCAIIVSTPQTLSIIDAFKAVDMLKKLKIAILGCIENMTYLTDHRGIKQPIFGKSRLREYCQDQEIKFLGSLPLLSNVARDYFFPDDNTYFQNILKNLKFDVRQNNKFK